MLSFQTKWPRIARMTQIVHDLSNKEQSTVTKSRALQEESAKQEQRPTQSTNPCALLSARSTPSTATSKATAPASLAPSSRQREKTPTSSCFPKPASRAIRRSIGFWTVTCNAAHSNHCKRLSTQQKASSQSSAPCAHQA